MTTAPAWALLVGAKGGSRTARLREVIAALGARSVKVGGVVQEPIEGTDLRDGYAAREVAGTGRATLARRATPGAPDDLSAQVICSFAFDPDALATVRAWVERDARVADVVALDEVSKLEVARAGHHDAVVSALRGPALPLLSVRADQLFAVMERFGLDEPVASLDAADGDEAMAAFVGQLVSAVRARAR